jgi:hypothetical protein
MPKSAHARLAAIVLVPLLNLALIVPVGELNAASKGVFQQGECRSFSETGKGVCGRFLAYWDEHGGLAQQGYPVSEELQEVSPVDGKTYTMQYFERAVFEYHPENRPPHDVLLSLLGSLAYALKYPRGDPRQTANAGPGSRLFPETGQRVGGLFLDYWLRNGGLAQQGYPVSGEFRERSDLDGRTYLVQYFERAVFEYHPENQAPYNVLLSQLGALRYRAKYARASERSDAGSVEPGGNMTVRRAAHSATLLPNGKVLIAGGMQRDGDLLSSAELYDPATRTFSPTGSLLGERVGHTATMLPNGKVLIAGGFGPGVLSSAELYDPATGRFTPTGSTSARRGGFTATLLPNGKVLITGGADGGPHASAELYDPVTGRFTPTGSMAEARSAHTATLLPGGKVLVAGGGTGDAGGTVLSSAEIYDPATGTFSPTGSMSVVRHKHAAMLLPDGRVLVIGGSNSRDWRGRYMTSEIYDPARGAFASAGNMSAARFKLSDAVALLPDGRSLVAGGAEQVEVYDPAASAFATVAGHIDAERFYATATTLADGSALIAGGYDTGIVPTAGAWIYKP